MAVGEACALVLPCRRARHGHDLPLLHGPRPADRRGRRGLHAAATPPDPDSFAWQVLTTLAGDASASVAEGRYEIALTMQSETPGRPRTEMSDETRGARRRGRRGRALTRTEQTRQESAALFARLTTTPRTRPSARRPARGWCTCTCRSSSTARAGSATAASPSRTWSRSAPSGCSSRSTGSTPTGAWSSRRTRPRRSSARSSATSATRGGRSGCRGGCRSCGCRSAAPAPSSPSPWAAPPRRASWPRRSAARSRRSWRASSRATPTRPCPWTPATARDDGPGSMLDSIGVDDVNLEHVEVRESLKPLLDRLDPREKKILLLRFFKNMTQSQIAEEIGVSQMHVSRLLSRDPRPAAELARGVSGCSGPVRGQRRGSMRGCRRQTSVDDRHRREHDRHPGRLAADEAPGRQQGDQLDDHDRAAGPGPACHRP